MVLFLGNMLINLNKQSNRVPNFQSNPRATNAGDNFKFLPSEISRHRFPLRKRQQNVVATLNTSQPFSWQTVSTWGMVNIQKNDGKSACSMGKSTISMAIFNSKLLNYQRGALNMDPGLVAIKATAFDRAPRRSTHKSCS
jgi:hypothetical protein